MIFGFPCNQFGRQEPKSNKEIQEFIAKKNVKFPVFAKLDVNGNNEDPLFTYLKQKKGGGIKHLSKMLFIILVSIILFKLNVIFLLT